MKIEFLGTAGYHPTEHRETSCILVSGVTPTADFLLDAGTGMHRLVGRQLPEQLHIFLTHPHLDHVCGLTYLYNVLLGQKTEVCIYGTRRTLETVRHGLFDSPLFPMKFSYPTVTCVPGEEMHVAGVGVRATELTHPGTSVAYRFQFGERLLAYVTDTEGDGRYLEFIRGVDFLIHERNFCDELENIALISGHCTSRDLLKAAEISGASKIAVTHFNPLTLTDPMDEDDLRAKLPQAVSASDGTILEW